MDERKRSSEPRGDNVCSLDSGHTSTCEANFGKHTGIDEEIPRPRSNGTTQHRGRRLGYVECEKHTYQTTIEEAESETVWPVESLRKERKSGLQVRNIATVENSSSVSRFAIGTLPSLEATESQATPMRSRRPRGRFRMGGRKDHQE